MENLSHNFNEHHIRANHNPSKKTNHQGNLGKAKVRPVSKLCTVPGKFENQIKVITTSKLGYHQTPYLSALDFRILDFGVYFKLGKKSSSKPT